MYKRDIHRFRNGWGDTLTVSENNISQFVFLINNDHPFEGADNASIALSKVDAKALVESLVNHMLDE